MELIAVYATPIMTRLLDWAILAVLAVPFIVILIVVSVMEGRRVTRAEREAAKLRHPSQTKEHLPKAA